MSERGESRAMIGTLTTVAFVCGLLIVTAFQVTKPVIAKNKAEQLRRSVFEVLPGSAKTEPLPLPGGEVAHLGLGEDGSLIGVAVEAKGQGFQDVIRVLYGYAPKSEAIVGMKVLDSKETPGLGDRIAKDPAFLSNFTALDARLAPDGSLAHPIAAVKHGQKANPWEIDGITGATISSKAVARLLRESAGRDLSKIRKAIK